MKLRSGRNINIDIKFNQIFSDKYNYNRINPINLSFEDRQIELNYLLQKCNSNNIILSKEFDYFFYSYEYYLLIYKILLCDDNYYNKENKENILKILTKYKTNEYTIPSLYDKYMVPLFNEIINYLIN
jgi:hypothetical protein